MLVALLNLIWVPIVAFADIAIPDKILTIPIIAAFVVSLTHFLTLYRLRVPVKFGQMMGAMFAAMSVQWTVSRAVANGLITEHLPFARTSKGGLSRMSVEFPGVLGSRDRRASLGRRGGAGDDQRQGSAGNLRLRRRADPAKPAVLSAVAIALLENSRINDFAFWRNARTYTAELIGIRPVGIGNRLPSPGNAGGAPAGRGVLSRMPAPLFASAIRGVASKRLNRCRHRPANNRR